MKFFTSPSSLGICAIFKNEGPYILEWLAAHRAVGVDTFFIADNNSTDGSSELLNLLGQQGVISYMPFPGVPGRPPQLTAYEELMRRHGSRVEWMAFIDADEFLTLTDGAEAFLPALERLAADPTVGAIAVNWALYGSSHEFRRRNEPVRARFHLRAEQELGVNRHFKTIVRTRAFAGFSGNPHACELKPGFRYVHTNGMPVHGVAGAAPGISQDVVWSGFRLNHYVIKSLEEFETKRARGRATTVNKAHDRGGAFFAAHDRNEVADPTPAAWLQRTQDEVRALAKGIPASLMERVHALAPVKTLHSPRSGYLDRIEVKNHELVFSGWAYTFDDSVHSQLQLTCDDSLPKVLKLVKVRRPDVFSKLPSIGEWCGFKASVWLDDLPAACDAVQGFRLEARTGDMVEVFQPGPGCQWPTADMAYARRLAAAVSGVVDMPAPCVQRLTRALEGAQTYLEYGTGGSTLLAAQSPVGALISLASDEKWAGAVAARVREVMQKGRRHLPVVVNIGPTRESGFPASDQMWKQYWTYPTEPWLAAQRHQLQPDLVLIDGRFRVACFLASLLYAQPGCTILFDDYAERDYYHSVELFLKPVEMVERMAVFLTPAYAPQPKALMPALAAAMTDAR